jgi:hypothetical protein
VKRWDQPGGSSRRNVVSLVAQRVFILELSF